jgi:hypothetical protein
VNKKREWGCHVSVGEGKNEGVRSVREKKRVGVSGQ